jgi:hypothetical protein
MVENYRGYGRPTEWIPMKDLMIDHRYQRDRKEGFISYLAANLDPDKFGSLTVSRRENGEQVILEGQQRFNAAMLALGDETQQVPCIILSGLTPEQESEIFWKGGRDRVPLTIFDLWKARLFQGDPSALQIRQCVEAAGLEIKFIASSKTHNEISCLGTLETMWQHVGNDMLTRILRILNLGLPNEIIGRQMLHGATLFVLSYGERLDDQKLIDRLKKTTSKDIIDRAESLKGASRGTVVTFVAWILLNDYNKRRPGEDRLPEKTPSSFSAVLRNWELGNKKTKISGTAGEAGEERGMRSRRAGGRQYHSPSELSRQQAQMARAREAKAKKAESELLGKINHEFPVDTEAAVVKAEDIQTNGVFNLKVLHDKYMYGQVGKSYVYNEIRKAQAEGLCSSAAMAAARKWKRA